MFTWLNLPALERRLDHLANSVAQYREAVQILKDRIVAERTEVRQAIADQIAEAVAPLQAQIETLKETIEELATRPEGTIDVAEVLADLDTLSQGIGEIYVAPVDEEETPPAIDLPINPDDEDEGDADSEKTTVDPVDVTVIEPQTSEPGTNREGNFVFPDPV